MENKNRVTFEELSDCLSHYEVCFLSYCKALDILRSGKSIIGENKYKSRVALVALEELCKNKDETLKFKEELKIKLFCKQNAEEHSDEYAVLDEQEIDSNL